MSSADIWAATIAQAKADVAAGTQWTGNTMLTQQITEPRDVVPAGTTSATGTTPTGAPPAAATPGPGDNLFSNIVDNALAPQPLVGTVAPQNQFTIGVPADAYAAATQKLGWLEVAAAVGAGGVIYLLFVRR